MAAYRSQAHDSITRTKNSVLIKTLQYLGKKENISTNDINE